MHPGAIRRVVFATDLIWICLSALVAYFLRTGLPLTPDNLRIAFHQSLFLITMAGISWVLVFYRLKLDGFYGGYEFVSVLSQLFSGLVALIILVASAAYLARDLISRLLIFYFAGLFFLGALGARVSVRVLARQLSTAGKRRRVLILGNGRIAREIAERIKQHPELRWELVGFLFPSGEDFGELSLQTERNNQLNVLQIESLLKQEQVEEIILASDRLEQAEILNLIANCRRRGIHISVVPHHYELYVTRPSLIDLDGLPLLALSENGPTLFQKMTKRVFDSGLSIIALILTSPLLVAGALVLWLQHRKVFGSESRCGRYGQVFQMYRFDSDRVPADISGLERLLQDLSVTELPQLINVLKGDMSLVGPRPETEDRVKRYSDWQRQRLVLKPGMTGLAQVHGLRDESSSEDKAYYDLRYMQNWSLLVDTSLILQTVWAVANRFFSTPGRRLNLSTTQNTQHTSVELPLADRT
ncbi:MAG: sugar transferase [Acidobacteriaceae bacterium]|nr:sugar transferase [Acidobacteriaceae bacterium]